MAHISLEMVQFLGERHPATVEMANIDGLLPLHIACNGQASLKILQFLVEMDSDAVEMVNNIGFWPLHKACRNDEPLDVVLSLVVEWSLSAFKWG
jgi:ankyrin repeat protein